MANNLANRQYAFRWHNHKYIYTAIYCSMMASVQEIQHIQYNLAIVFFSLMVYGLPRADQEQSCHGKLWFFLIQDEGVRKVLQSFAGHSETGLLFFLSKMVGTSWFSRFPKLQPKLITLLPPFLRILSAQRTSQIRSYHIGNILSFWCLHFLYR